MLSGETPARARAPTLSPTASRWPGAPGVTGRRHVPVTCGLTPARGEAATTLDREALAAVRFLFQICPLLSFLFPVSVRKVVVHLLNGYPESCFSICGFQRQHLKSRQLLAPVAPFPDRPGLP